MLRKSGRCRRLYAIVRGGEWASHPSGPGWSGCHISRLPLPAGGYACISHIDPIGRLPFQRFASALLIRCVHFPRFEISAGGPDGRARMRWPSEQLKRRRSRQPSEAVVRARSLWGLEAGGLSTAWRHRCTQLPDFTVPSLLFYSSGTLSRFFRCRIALRIVYALG